MPEPTIAELTSENTQPHAAHGQLVEAIIELADTFRTGKPVRTVFDRGYNGGLSDAADTLEIILRVALGLRPGVPLPGAEQRQQERLRGAAELNRKLADERAGVNTDEILAWILANGGDVRSTALAHHIAGTYGVTWATAIATIHRLNDSRLAAITSSYRVAVDGA
ncbi:hypothetical protein [Leifsonia sp. Leaf264]|uniref:hypothetical protein n=1 Tax=Leifsonia sp. Leaf264 TaxID=1736314 RepID=UPI0006F90FDE|nr:hypothetical protein [Leifsonia sp. Leaf264]KQO98391.1 hypothetical protein ASF30_10040 [Leifsonia sp. Leaf264]